MFIRRICLFGGIEHQYGANDENHLSNPQAKYQTGSKQ